MRIITHSEFFIKFYTMFHFTFSKPQRKNFLKLADAIIFSTGYKKTIRLCCNMYSDPPDEYAMAGFFHTSTWDPQSTEIKINDWAINESGRKALLKGNGITLVLDDTIIEKYKDSKFELCEYIYDHAKQRYIRGIQIVTLKVVLPDNSSITLAIKPYISKNKSYQLEKKYGKSDEYTFKTKNEIAYDLVRYAISKLPENLRVFVCFDSWYASAEYIKKYREMKATVICEIKSNRKFNGKKIGTQFSSRRRRDWTHKRVRYAASTRRYYVRNTVGKLNGINGEVRIIASRLHLGTKRPVFFMCTDTTLSVSDILDRYAKRWQCETDYQYLKNHLGLGDFRVQSARSIQRYAVIVHFADIYLQYRQMDAIEKKKCFVPLGEIIRKHNNEHHKRFAKEILTLIDCSKKKRIAKKLLAA